MKLFSVYVTITSIVFALAREEAKNNEGANSNMEKLMTKDFLLPKDWVFAEGENRKLDWGHEDTGYGEGGPYSSYSYPYENPYENNDHQHHHQHQHDGTDGPGGYPENDALPNKMAPVPGLDSKPKRPYKAKSRAVRSLEDVLLKASSSEKEEKGEKRLRK